MIVIKSNRRYDIDWLRVIAIGLLLIYHIAIGFQPWGVFIQFIQSNTSLDGLWVPMAMLNIWRIPLLFFVSGMGVSFAMRKRNFKELIKERSKRILLPFIFGVFAIVPLHIILWQKYYSQDISYPFLNPSHLWFLGNIFMYLLILSPIFFYLKKYENGKVVRILQRILRNPLGLLFVIGSFVIEAVIINPQSFELYALTKHGFFLGLIAFLFGFVFVISGNAFWENVLKWKWLYLSIALSFSLVRIFLFEFKLPNALMPIESCSWIFALFGIAYQYLNKPSKTLTYLSEGAYPIYIIHMAFLYLGSYLIFPLKISVLLKFPLTVLFTGVTCVIFYEFGIKRVSFLRPLFGLKTVKVKAN